MFPIKRCGHVSIRGFILNAIFTLSLGLTAVTKRGLSLMYSNATFGPNYNSVQILSSPLASSILLAVSLMMQQLQLWMNLSFS